MNKKTLFNEENKEYKLFTEVEIVSYQITI